MRKALRWVAWVCAGLLLLLALATLAVHFLVLQVPERRAEIQAWVNRASGLDLRLPNLSARWTFSGPEIFATNVEVRASRGGARLARAREVTMAADLWRMLSRGEWLSGRVRLISPEVRLIRTPDGKIRLEGRTHKERQKPLDAAKLPSGSLEIVDGRLILSEESRELLRLEGLRLKLDRHHDDLNFFGSLQLQPALGAALKFSGAVRGPLDNAARLRWEARAEGRDLHLAGWRHVLGGRWRAFDPRGEVHTLAVTAAKKADGEPRFTAAARFAGLGFESVGKIPGLQGLDGDVSASESSGKVRLTSSSFVFLMPWRFREPLRADSVKGEVSWRREDGWKIASRGFFVRNPHARFTTDIDLALPADGSSPVLKLHSRFEDAVVAEGWRYLPTDRLGEKTLAWLDKAFLAGHVPAGEFVFDGPTRKFPFRDGGGEFRVSFPVEGRRLHYGQGWPDLENLAVDVEFRNQGLTGTVRSGEVNGLAIASGGTAQFVDFKIGELTVRGQASGDIGDALGFVRQSPLGKKFGKTFMSLRGQGPAQAEIDLLLPVKHLDDRRVALAVKFGGDRIGLEGTAHELRALSGTLRIDSQRLTRLTASNLSATYLGGSAVIDLGGGPAADKNNVVRVRAQTPAAAFAAAVGMPSAVGLSGILNWRAMLRVPLSGPPVRLRIDSTLRGAEIGLPAPIHKTADETRPLRIEVQWPDATQALARVGYGDFLRSRLEFSTNGNGNNGGGDGKDGGWRLARGNVWFGGGEAPPPAEEGLVLEGALDTFDLSDWLAVRSDKPGGRPLSSYLREVDVSVRDFGLYGFRFADVTGRMTPGERAWNVTVNGPQARGQVRVPFDPQGPEPLTINMRKVVLLSPGNASAPESGNANATQAGPGGRDSDGGVDPRKWPAIRASVDDFTAWNKHFGVMRAELERVPQGLELTSLHSSQSSFTLTGSGSWLATPEGQRSRLALRLESTDMLETLRQLGYGASLTGEKGLATLDLNWPGAPDARLLGKLSGTMKVSVENGQLVGVQPGAGRVFGLMSVAMLRRRLALDFSDLTDKGLAFDSILGDFELKSGNAYTSNLLLKGPAAEIGVIGRTGLETRDYDQTAVVTGNVGESLPVAGALAGGPVVGAAMLVFSQIFKQPLKGIARGYYRITGSWDEPSVQRVEASEVKQAFEK